jgi:hypothetical protein
MSKSNPVSTGSGRQGQSAGHRPAPFAPLDPRASSAGAPGFSRKYSGPDQVVSEGTWSDKGSQPQSSLDAGRNG